MDSSDVATLLDEAQRRFEESGTNFEAGLDVDDPTTLQLRKACRLLDAATLLEAQNGYFTVAVESAFGAIERTIQFYLLEQGLLTEDEYVDHVQVYERGVQAGLYDDSFAGKLEALWRNNRSETYYREGVATEDRARTMLELAAAVHVHVLSLAGCRHECVCRES